MPSSSLLLATAAVAAIFGSSAAQLAAATSCGEPRLSASDTCSDWQCSRIIYPLPPTPSPVNASRRLLEGDNTNDGNGTYYGYGLCVRGLGEGAYCSVDSDCLQKKYVCRLVSTNSSSGEVTWASRCTKMESDKAAWQGYIGVAVAVVGFGTNFVPAKQVRSGNGMLFQLAQCLAVIIAGITVALVTKQYTLYPMSLIGGLLWCLGNCLCVPIIQLVGLGIGLSVWGTTNMLVGWASGRFGFMGVEEEIAPTPWRSYTGVGIAILAICAFASVKPSTDGASKKKKKKDEEGDVSNSLETVPLNGPNDYGHGLKGAAAAYSPTAANNDHVYAEDEVIRRRADHVYAGDEDVRRHRHEEEAEKASSGTSRRVLGLVLSVVAGIFFGLNFNPSQAMMDHYDERTLEDSSMTPSIHFSPIGVDYFFSFSMGVAMTSISVTVLFYGVHTLFPQSCVKRFVPSLFDDMHLLDFGAMLCPGFVSGLIWSCAQIGWFVANTNLGLAVTFPLIGVGPSLVANAWGIFLFREVEGLRNFLLMGLAFGFVGLSCGFTVWAQSS